MYKFQSCSGIFHRWWEEDTGTLMGPAAPANTSLLWATAHSSLVSMSHRAKLSSLLGVSLSPKTWGDVGEIELGSDLGLEKLSTSSLCASAASPMERWQEPSCFGYQQCSVDGSCSH